MQWNLLGGKCSCYFLPAKCMFHNLGTHRAGRTAKQPRNRLDNFFKFWHHRFTQYSFLNMKPKNINSSLSLSLLYGIGPQTTQVSLTSSYSVQQGVSLGDFTAY